MCVDHMYYMYCKLAFEYVAKNVIKISQIILTFGYLEAEMN
jgi:hypothetical protein